MFRLPLDSVTWYATHPDDAVATGLYASLFGANGVTIPVRGSGTFENDVVLDDYTISKMIDSPLTGIRWFVRLPVNSRDHLSGTDGITLNAWLRVEGTTSSDAVVTPYGVMIFLAQ